MNSIKPKNRSILGLQSILLATTLFVASTTLALEESNNQPTDAQRAELGGFPIKDIIGKYPSITIIEEQPINKRYGTCHNYAISKKLGLKGKISKTFPIIGIEDWYKILHFTKKYCHEVSTPQKGDLVTYHDNPYSPTINHTGLVYDDGIVESKWGIETEILIHPTFYVPPRYGKHVKYHRINKETNEIIEDLKKTISQCNYKQICADLNNELVNYAEQANNNEIWRIWQMHLCTHIEASNIKGQSLLIIGAKTNNYGLVQEAIFHKANLNKKDNDGKTALDFAKENQNASIVNLLEQAQRNKKPFYYRILKRIIKPSKMAQQSFWKTVIS